MADDHGFFPQTMSLAVHELRTPITVAAGYLRMLLREQGGPLNEKQRKMLEEADRSCARIATLVEEMSDLGKLEGGRLKLTPKPLDLTALVAELASDMHEGHDRGVRLEIRGTGQPLMVSGDRQRLAAALKSLIFSVLRERGEPGVVVVQCSYVGDAPGWAVVAIGDEAQLPGLLQQATADSNRFYEWRGGLGLALLLARRVIDAHGGALWSLNAPASLPVDREPPAASALRLPRGT